MDDYTKITKTWLEKRYSGNGPIYYAHEPIYGLGANVCEPNHARRVVRLYQLLCAVRELGGRTMLDVGGSEAYFSFLCRELFGMDVVSVDLSAEACRRAAEIFEVPGAAVDGVRLPFSSDTFDIVTCAEVVEHLSNPVPSILELQRVSSSSIVLATEEWLASSEQRDELLATRGNNPHGERSIYADCDARALFYPSSYILERQQVPNLSALGNDSSIDHEALRSFLLNLEKRTDKEEYGVNGIIISARKNATAKDLKYRATNEEIAEMLLEHASPLHKIPQVTPIVPLPEWCSVQCPMSELPMQKLEEGYKCPKCETQFNLSNGIFELFCPVGLGEDAGIEIALHERGDKTYQNQLEELKILAKKLHKNFFESGRSWSLALGEDLEQWELNPELEHAKGTLFRAIASDPQMISPWLGFRLTEIDYVEISMAVYNEDQVGDRVDFGEVFFWVEGMADFSQDASNHFVIKKDGKERIYRVQIPDYVRRMSDKLLRIRLDPAREPANIRVNRISLVDVKEPVGKALA